jgi:hypothetical protein
VNPVDTAEEALIKEGAKLVFELAKTVFKGIGVLTKTIDEKVKIQEAAFKYCKRYSCAWLAKYVEKLFLISELKAILLVSQSLPG